MAEENVKKSIPLLIPLRGVEAPTTKPHNEDIKKSIRLYIEVK